MWTLLRALLVLALAASAAAAGHGYAASQPSVFVQFRTPSNNIGCTGSVGGPGLPGTLRCDILSGLRPQPRRRCLLDWTGFTLGSRGAARPVCAGDTAYDARAPLLRYGKTWRQGGYVCTSRRSSLHCTNRAGRGFVLSRARSFTF
jgi:uncharacterized protein DUF6636